MKHKVQRSLLLGICLVWLLSAGCSTGAKSQSSCTRYRMFLDLSASISEGQRARWREMIERVLARIQPGDAILIQPVHDHTLDAAPLFERETAPLSDDAVYDEVWDSKQALRKLRKDAMEAVNKAFISSSRSRSTAIFSAIDRYRPDSKYRRTIIIWFSDMLESASEPNMERTRLTPQAIPRLIKTIAEQHHWDNNTLAGATIHCILNSIEIGQPQSLNDRRTLKLFYETLFNALGARLETFDTYLTD